MGVIFRSYFASLKFNRWFFKISFLIRQLKQRYILIVSLNILVDNRSSMRWVWLYILTFFPIISLSAGESRLNRSIASIFRKHPILRRFCSIIDSFLFQNWALENHLIILIRIFNWIFLSSQFIYMIFEFFAMQHLSMSFTCYSRLLFVAYNVF